MGWEDAGHADTDGRVGDKKLCVNGTGSCESNVCLSHARTDYRAAYPVFQRTAQPQTHRYHKQPPYLVAGRRELQLGGIASGTGSASAR